MFKKLQIRENFISGLLVSFVALPLCIAISLASGFPALSGIFTAIIGGILVSQISGSNLAINGPAAGMIVVILEATEKLGDGDLVIGYKYTLGAIICASIIQIATSFTKLPEMMKKFPEAIIRGMMMAIGLIVIIKQIFNLFGFKAPKTSMIELFAKIPQAFLGMQIDTFLLGILTILLIIIWKNNLGKRRFFKAIPVYLVAIIFGSLIANFFQISDNRHYLIASLSAPIASEFINLPNSIIDSFALPNFSKFFSYEFVFATLTIYAVGSLETILSTIAVDKIDPLRHHRSKTTNLKKDLRAIGIGNLCCGLIGGLPMITEIVRSSANVKYGATNKWSNFFHGACLLLMITILNPMLKFIPLCVLSGMLILIGYNLINIHLFTKIYRRHLHNFLIIIAVIFFTIGFDLLVGILVGLFIYYLNQKFLRKKF